MSSTVTTATVAAVTAAVTAEDLSKALTFVTVALLAVFLIAKEVTARAENRSVRSLARGLDIGLAALAVAFFTLVIGGMASLFQS